MKLPKIPSAVGEIFVAVVTVVLIAIILAVIFKKQLKKRSRAPPAGRQLSAPRTLLEADLFQLGRLSRRTSAR